MQKLTKKFIEKVALPERKQVIYRDSELKGFGLRATPGGLSFIVEARINGKSKRRSVGRADLLSLDDARRKAKELLAQMTAGTDPQEEKEKQEAQELCLGDALDEFLANKRLKLNTRNNYRRHLYGFFPDWITKPLKDITPAMIVERQKQLPKPNKFGTMGLSTVNSSFQMLRAVINYAIDNLDVKIQNPVVILNKNRAWYKLNRTKSVVTDQQLPEYWKAVASLKRVASRDFFILLLLTGLRRSEAQTLLWENVDLEAKTLKIPAELAKNHHEHILPLSDVLVELLTHRKTLSGNTEWVFPRSDGMRSLSHQTYSSQLIGKKIGCEFSPHAARRTFVTMASRMGLPHPIVKKLVNHIQFVDIASTYIILSHECLREPMQQITDKFMSLMQCDPDPWWPSSRKLDKAPTLREVLVKMLETKKLRPGSKINYEKCIRLDLGDWLALPLNKITEVMIEERKQKLLAKKKWLSVHQTFSVLRLLFNFAGKNFAMPNGRDLKNPVLNLKHVPESSFRRAFIEDATLPAWYAALQETDWNVSRDYMLFVLLSGMQMRQAMTLKWSDVGLDYGVISVRGEVCQNGHAYKLPLSSFLWQFLRERRSLCPDSLFVFPGRFGNTHLRSCQRVIDQVSLKTGSKFIMPDMRRTFVNAGLRAGVAPHLVKALINSVDSRNSVDMLLKPSFDELRSAMEKISGRLLGLMNCNIEQSA